MSTTNQLEIEIVAPDKLSCKTWKFIYFDDWHIIVLDSYHEWKRTTPRHKYKSTGVFYSRLSRDNGSFASEADVPFPDDIKSAVKQTFVDSLRVGTWEQRYPPQAAGEAK